MIQINPAFPGFTNLRDLIEANNGGEAFLYDLNESNIEFGAPTTYSDVGNPTANTQVTVTALLDQGFSGSVDVSYYRPTLAEAHTTPGSQIEVSTSLAETDMEAYAAVVKTAIATAMQLREADFELAVPAADVPVPSSENNPVTVDIVPVSTSLIYAGGAFTVTFAAVDTDVPLDQVITVTALNGFDF